jgi:MoaA/NifB/PqqE/SkfB family radical SAM enzyme
MQETQEEKIDFEQITSIHYNVDLTFKCNWDCWYCCADTHNQDEQIDDASVMNQLAKVPNNTIVSFAGGEPGMVSKDLIIKYCEILKEKNCVITVDTNGLFLEKYPDLVVKYISDVLYHTVQDVRSRKEIKLYHFDHIPVNDNFIYQLVVTNKDSFEDIEWYLNKYPQFQFAVIGANAGYVKEVYQSGLDRKLGFKIYQKYKDRLFLPHAPLLFLESDDFENCVSLRTKDK